MKASRVAVLLCAVLLAILAVARQVPSELRYHDHFPTEPQPQTLDPLQFEPNRNAFVAYTLAARIASILHQVPCYCGCDKEQGHKSLLDCFTGKHGSVCHICQKEVLFCYVRSLKHQDVRKIREAMDRDEMAKLDFRTTVAKFYAQIRKSGK